MEVHINLLTKLQWKFTQTLADHLIYKCIENEMRVHLNHDLMIGLRPKLYSRVC